MTDKGNKLQQLLTSSTKTVFTTGDIGKIWRYENYNSLIKRIEYFLKTDKLLKIKKGLFAINGREIDNFELANKLRQPSYISFETVLYREGLIFQPTNSITLASKESIRISLHKQKFLYRQLKDEILLQKKGILEKNNCFFASKERALLDILYISPSFSFDNLRNLDFAKIQSLLPIYQRSSLQKIIKKLQKYAG